MVPLGITNTIDYHIELHGMVVGYWEKGEEGEVMEGVREGVGVTERE